MLEVVKVPLSRIRRMEVYENTDKKPLQRIVAEREPDIAFTAVFYDPKKWQALCPAKADGRVLCRDEQYDYWALAWNAGSDAAPQFIPAGTVGAAASYVSNCLLVLDGRPQHTLYYGKDVGGSRGRVAVALKDGQLYVLACADGFDAMTPEELRDLCAGLGVDFALMQDGGRKVNFYCRENEVMLQGKDPSHTLVLIWLQHDMEKEGAPVSERKKVCLDAGHDAANLANKSPDGSYFEHEFALDMAKRMAAVLEAAGVDVVETRPAGDFVSLNDRCRIANEAGADLFVSLHSNAAAAPGWSSARGWMALVYGLSGERYAAAKAILSRVEGVCPAIRKNALVADPDLWVLKHTKAPAVLIEHGFHTNREDVNLLKDSKYRQRLAEAQAHGILDWLGIPVPTPEEKPAEAPEMPAEKSEAELAVEWITGAGIMLGDAAGDLMLEQPLTRKQFAVMLYRYKQQK